MSEVEELPIASRQQNFSIMEPFDKQSKMTDQDTGDDYTQDSFTEKFLAGGEQDHKKQKYSKKQIMDTNSLQLKREFDDMLKKEEMNKTKAQNEAELKKLLNDNRIYTKEKNKKLEAAYTTFQKLIEEDLNQGSKPTLKNFSTKSLQFPQILDNRNAHSLDITGMASTDENINYLQSKLAELREKSDSLQHQIISETDKGTSLTAMQKELKKSAQMQQEEINGHDQVLEAFQKQIDQADEKTRKYQNDVHATQVEILKYQRYLRADQKQKESFISDKNKSIDDQKSDLKESMAEYKKLQNELERARTENDRKVEEIKEINKKLRTKFELMIESRKLLRELDDFDKLTKLFIYGDPSKHELQELEKQAKEPTDGNEYSEENQDLEAYISSDQNSPSPTYKQGSIITRLRRFYKFHGEDLNSVVEQILKIYSEYNMQNHTLQRRLDDLQEQKRKLGIIWNDLISQYDQNGDKVQLYQSDDDIDELSSPLKKKSSSNDIVKPKKSRINQRDINDLQQFIGHCFLFLNESLFRMVGITSLVRGIPNSQDVIKKDEKFQNDYFKNELFDNLQAMINYSITNKGLMMSQKAIEDDSKKDITSSNQLSNKIIEISKSFQKNLPEIIDKTQIFNELVKKDFVLLNFCQLESYTNFFEYLRSKIDGAQNAHTPEDIWKIVEEKLQTKLREEGREVFTKMLKKLLTYIEQLLSRVGKQKQILEEKLMELNPDSPHFKPSHIRKRLEEKKTKKKDWKDKLVKNKIKEYESYQGITVEQEQSAAGGFVQYLADLVSQSEAGQQKGEMDFEDERKHIDSIWQKEKGNIVKRAKEQKEIQSKVQEKPKVNSKYGDLKNGKYGLKYTESWKYLVKAKKEFANYVWDAENETFADTKTLRTQLPKINDGQDNTKPEHLFSHVMYQSSHPHLESKFNQSQRLRMNTVSMSEQDMATLRKPNSTQLANMRQLSNNPKSSTQRDNTSDRYKMRSRSQANNTSSNSQVLSKSRLLDARDENKLMQIRTNSLNKGYGKPMKIHTSSAIQQVSENSQMI